MTWVVWIVAVAVTAFTLWRLGGLPAGYPLAPLIALSPYAVLAFGLLAGLAMVLRRWAAGAVIVACALALAVAIAPRGIPDSQPDAPGGTELTVVAFNALAGRADPEAIVALIKSTDADVLAISELTPSLATELDEAGIQQVMPASELAVRPDIEGVGIYSRTPIAGVDPGAEAAARAVVASVELANGAAVELHAVHPGIPTVPGARWQDGLASLPGADPGGTIRILAGDFNATLDHAELRDVIASGYADAADATGSGLRPTWPVGRHLPPVVIDHILADERVAITYYDLFEVPGSDHRAIVADLFVPAPVTTTDQPQA